MKRYEHLQSLEKKISRRLQATRQALMSPPSSFQKDKIMKQKTVPSNHSLFTKSSSRQLIWRKFWVYHDGNIQRKLQCFHFNMLKVSFKYWNPNNYEHLMLQYTWPWILNEAQFFWLLYRINVVPSNTTCRKSKIDEMEI